jgi:predicted enzyme related to lactoylglutathione lyase
MDIPVGENMIYTMLNLNGKPVAALSNMQEEQKSMGMQSYWSSYIAVDDAESILKKATENGATVIVPVMQIMEEGKMGIIQDTDGAYLGIWEAQNMKGFAYKDEAGAVCWFEQGCHDRNKCITFYENVFGWKASTNKMGETVYTTYMLNDNMVGGLYELTPEMEGVPSHWLPYFGISDVDNALEKTSKLGGNILMQKLYVEGVGYFAVAQDPQGGVFGLLQID